MQVSLFVLSNHNSPESHDPCWSAEKVNPLRRVRGPALLFFNRYVALDYSASHKPLALFCGYMERRLRFFLTFVGDEYMEAGGE